MSRRNIAAARAFESPNVIQAKETHMLGRILGAIAGEKLAGRNRGAQGALIGAAIPMIARRGLGPLGLVLGAGWVAKKLYDRRRGNVPQAPVVS
jgi:hypothetical protein